MNSNVGFPCYLFQASFIASLSLWLFSWCCQLWSNDTIIPMLVLMVSVLKKTCMKIWENVCRNQCLA
ncbi:CLUMA_CG003917, isoform A [Clunio marinus]|uniref:CLUMA_CG003917, isoform A n=1 Tax=Clunio marinus TaxID=568069 RepID=A0A1J1HQF4_9DIPT|nr:CLUMA_CG003917, isoform A [Clunio marinus]